MSKTNYIIHKLRRTLDDAQRTRGGMTVGFRRLKVHESDLKHLLDHTERVEIVLAACQKRIAELEQQVIDTLIRESQERGEYD